MLAEIGWQDPAPPRWMENLILGYVRLAYCTEYNTFCVYTLMYLIVVGHITDFAKNILLIHLLPPVHSTWSLQNLDFWEKSVKMPYPAIQPLFC